jgi:serine/threonine protein kinase
LPADPDFCLDLEPYLEAQILPPGTVVAQRYSIVEVLGQGGMGVVYKAEHIHMEKVVALKMMLETTSAASADYRRFQREARAASQLDHPNIVRIHDFGFADSQAYLCMDFLEGKSLEQILRAGPLSLDRFRHVFAQACAALQHAHDKGMVHRDLKPSNLMIVERDEDKEFVVVLDFGLVKMMDGRSDSKLTATNMVLGSPLYMSPEQCRAVDLDHRSDIYSLACVMYEALAGVPPLNANNAFDIMNKHISVLPPAIREAAPGVYVPAALEKLIYQALSKAPEDRPASMAELSRGIEQSFSGAPDPLLPVVQTLKPGAGQDLKRSESRRKSRRNFILSSAGVWVSVVLLLCTGMLLDELIHHGQTPRLVAPPARPGQTTTASSESGSSAGTDTAPAPDMSSGETSSLPGDLHRFLRPVKTAGKTLTPDLNPGQTGGAAGRTAGAVRDSAAQPGAVSRVTPAAGESPAGDSAPASIAAVRNAAGDNSAAVDPAEQLALEGNVAFNNGNWADARRKYDQVISGVNISEVRTPALARLVIASFNLRDLRACHDYLKKFKDQFSFNPGIMADDVSVLSQVLVIARQLSEGEDYAFQELLMRRIIEFYAGQDGHPTTKSILVKMELNRLFVEQGKRQDAENILREALHDAEQIGDRTLVASLSHLLRFQNRQHDMGEGGPGGFGGPFKPFGGRPGRRPGGPVGGQFGGGQFGGGQFGGAPPDGGPGGPPGGPEEP